MRGEWGQNIHMNKKFYILLLTAVLITLYLVYILFLNRVDTRYAVDFSNVFSTYDINSIDNYLTDKTIIKCNKKRATYAELRNNVELACTEKKYHFDSSYGHGNNKFKNNIQEVTVYLFGKLNNESIGEVNILMNLKKTGFFKFEISSLECNEAIFEYLFYGNK